MTIHPDILKYNAAMKGEDKAIGDALAKAIDRGLARALGRGGGECKIWHRHPVWFIEGNPIVGYSKLKDSVRLLFWSGQSFDEPGLTNEGSFKAAEARYTSADEINSTVLSRWLKKSIEIQWDYKNIVKRKGRLEWLKGAGGAAAKSKTGASARTASKSATAKPASERARTKSAPKVIAKASKTSAPKPRDNKGRTSRSASPRPRTRPR